MYKKNFLSRKPTKRTKTMKRGTSRLRREAAPQKEMMGPRRPMKKGGSLKPVDKSKNPGLAKLPTKVRNKMGFMKDGGLAKRNKASKAIFRNIKTKDAFKKASGKK